MDLGELEPLSKGAQEYGISLSEFQLTLFYSYLNELWEWNKHINLTGLSTRRRVIIELFLDSLLSCTFIPEKGRLLDVGAGAGFPGLPIKICRPDVYLTLIEANLKRVNFLRQIIRLRKLDDIVVINGRIEKDQGELDQRGYDIVSARAIADISQTVAWCSPHLCNEGNLICFLGKNIEKELNNCRDIIEEQGLIIDKTFTYTLPGKETQRNMVIFSKKKSHG